MTKADLVDKIHAKAGLGVDFVNKICFGHKRLLT